MIESMKRNSCTKITALFAVIFAFLLSVLFIAVPRADALPSLDGAQGLTQNNWQPTSSYGGVTLYNNTEAPTMASSARQLSNIYIGKFDYNTAVDIPVTYKATLQTFDQWKAQYTRAYDLIGANASGFASLNSDLTWAKFCAWAQTKGYITSSDSEAQKQNKLSISRFEEYLMAKTGRSLYSAILQIRHDPTNDHTFGDGTSQIVSPALGDWIHSVDGSMENPAIVQDAASGHFYRNYVITDRWGWFQANDIFMLLKFPGIATAYTDVEGSVPCDMYVAFSNLILASGAPNGTNNSVWLNGSGPFVSVGDNSIVVTSQYSGGGTYELGVDVEIFFVPVETITGIKVNSYDDLNSAADAGLAQRVEFDKVPRDPTNEMTYDMYLVGSNYSSIASDLDDEHIPFAFAMTDIDQAWNASSLTNYGDGYCEHVLLYDGTSDSKVLAPGQTNNLHFNKNVLVTPDTWNSWSSMQNYGLFYNDAPDGTLRNSNSLQEKADTGFVALTTDAWGKYRWYGSTAGTEVMYLDGSIPMCDIKITKKSDEESWVNNLNTYSKAGARYSVWQDSMEGKPLLSVTTGADGTIKTGKLLCGHTYYIKEIYPSPGHALDPNVYTINGTTDGMTYELSSTDPVVYTKFGIVKGDSQMPGQGNDPMGDATFKGARFRVTYYDGLYGSAESARQNGTVKSQGLFETDELAEILVPQSTPVEISNWDWTKDGLCVCPIGTYVIQEIKSVDGYDVNGSEYIVQVTRKQNTAGTDFEAEAKRFDTTGAKWVGTHVQTGDLDYWTIDQPEIWRGGMDLMKVDSTTMENWAEGNATLKNAMFRVYNVSLHDVIINDVTYPTYKQKTMVPQVGDYNGRAVGKYNINTNDIATYKPIATLYTDENGLCSIPNYTLPYGTYVIYELNPPVGYLINKNFEKGVEFTVRQHGQMADFISIDEKDKHYWNDHNGAWDDTIAPNPSVVPDTNPPGVTR